MHRSLLLLALAPACSLYGSSADDGGPLAPESLPSEGRTYVIDRIEVGSSAADVSAIALDLDGDERPDNYFGGSLSAAESALGVDMDAAIAESLAAGDLLHLLLFAEDDTGEVLDTGRLFLGADTDGDPENNFSGDAALAIRPGSDTAGAAFGDVSLDRVDLGDGAFTIENVLFTPIRMPLVGARITGTFDELGTFYGRIGGGIAADEVDRLRLGIAASLADEGNQMCDPSQIPCCPPDSRGETYMEVFDDDHDCQLTDVEVAGSSILRILLTPDVDFDGDGENDAMSVAFRISAVPARFEIP